MIVDAHFHIWQPARGDYGWLTPALGAIHRDIDVSDWRRVAAPCGVQRGVRHVVDAFGPELVLWGSDWPVLERVVPYAHWWQLSVELTQGLADAHRRAIFGGNAARVYRLGRLSA